MHFQFLLLPLYNMKVPDSSLWSSIDEATTAHADTPSTSSASDLGASPAIDRHNPIILSDSRRTSNPALQHAKQVAAAAHQKKKSVTDQKAKRKSVGKSVDFINGSSCAMMSSSLFTPPGSSRYLLSENMISDDLYPAAVLALETDEKVTSPSSSLDSNCIFSSSSDKPSNKNSEQVVVLRVSLHCKGCAAKVRKHISRMEGVTSFNIDFAAKKVTVVGDVTPLEVLTTISKVKNAQLWTPETPILSRVPR